MAYSDITACTSHSSTLDCRNDHCTTSLRTRLNAFYRSTKAKNRDCFFAKCFSINCLVMKMASFVPLPGVKLNCMLSVFTWARILRSKMCSITSIPWSMFYRSVRTADQRVAFTFVERDESALSPIFKDRLFRYQQIAKVQKPLDTQALICRQHFCTDSWWTGGFSFLHSSQSLTSAS